MVAEVTAKRQRPPRPGLSGRGVPAHRGLADSGARHGGAAPGPVRPFALPRRPYLLHRLAADGLGQVNAQAVLALL